KSGCEHCEWGHLFLHKDLPPLPDSSPSPLIDASDEQLLLLAQLEIQKPENPYRKGHFIDDHRCMAEEVLTISLLWEDAFPTIRVSLWQCPIYTVMLIHPVSKPSLLI